MKFELHCHSHYSRGKKIPVEGIDSPGDLVRRAKRMGLDGLALTDHSTSKGWKEASQEARRQGLIFIPAIEISSSSGHIIGLGLNEHIESGLAVEETVERVHEQGGVAVAAHPFDVRREGIGKSSAKADVVEVFNSMNLDMFSNWVAGRFASRNGKPRVAGSDSHTKEMLGRCINCIDAFDMDSALKEIKVGRTSFHGRYMRLEEIIPWIRQRMVLSQEEILRYVEARYGEPRKWAAKRLLRMFSNGRYEAVWYAFGTAGIAGSEAYGAVKLFSRL